VDATRPQQGKYVSIKLEVINMEDIRFKSPFKIEEFKIAEFPQNIIFAKDYMLLGEEKSAINKAVQACVKAGGGTVVVNEGEWVTGPIHLSANIHLQLEKDALIRFSENFSDYLPVVFARWEGMECYNYSPFIYAKDSNNIAITGEGKLMGGGEAWWHWKKLQQKAANELCYAQSNNIPVEKRVYGTEEAALRPSFIQFVNCKNIQLRDFTIEDGPQWMIHPVYCENVIVSGITIY